MPKDGISRLYCYSLTDLHDFDGCPFRFYVNHHLLKKYEIETGNQFIALGNLLDQAIKKIHKYSLYQLNLDNEDLYWIIREVDNDMRQQVQEAIDKGKNHFYQSSIPFLTAECIDEGYFCLREYIKTLKGNGKELRKGLRDLNNELIEVGFCDWIIQDNGEMYKLWGGPDTLEIGYDGVIEIADYKSKKNIEKGKLTMDMNLMPKIYTLLVSRRLKLLGYKKVRFIVRFWQDPLDDSFCEEFDLENINQYESIFIQKINNIVQNRMVSFCDSFFCSACKSDRRDEFIEELEKFNLLVADTKSERSELGNFIDDNQTEVLIDVQTS
jgi:hypothetical protein